MSKPDSERPREVLFELKVLNLTDESGDPAAAFSMYVNPAIVTIPADTFGALVAALLDQHSRMSEESELLKAIDSDTSTNGMH